MRRWRRLRSWIAAGCSFAAACGRDSAPPTELESTLPRISVRVTTVDQRPVPAGSVRVRRNGATLDSVALGADGTARIATPTLDSVDLVIGVESAYYGSTWREAFARDTTIDVLLIPRSWIVQRGVHAGATRVLDLVKAVSTDVPNTHFLNGFAVGQRRVAAWPLSALPITVGFDTSGGAPRWTAQDSAFFWSSVAELNGEFGREVFRAVSLVESPLVGSIGVRIDRENQGPRGVLFNRCDVPSRLCVGRAGQVWMGRGFSYPGVFADANRRLVKHELLHALGFGHGCYWQSLMILTSLSCIHVTELPTGITADDVAYVEMMFQLATALETRPAAWAIDEAVRATLGARAGTIAEPPFNHYATSQP